MSHNVTSDSANMIVSKGQRKTDGRITGRSDPASCPQDRCPGETPGAGAHLFIANGRTSSGLLYCNDYGQGICKTILQFQGVA